MTSFNHSLLNDYTCVIKENQAIIYTSKKRGVAPILDFYHQANFVKKDYTVIDKIMGKSAVLLSLLIGAKHIQTPTISEPGLAIAKHHKIQVDYDRVVPYIMNRDNTGPCPIENSVLDIDDVELGYQRIIQKLKSLAQKNKDKTND
jgi:hypothetical protein